MDEEREGDQFIAEGPSYGLGWDIPPHPSSDTGATSREDDTAGELFVWVSYLLMNNVNDFKMNLDRCMISGGTHQC